MIVKVVIPDSIYARVYFARGEQGPQGATGPQGPQGSQGPTGLTGPAGTNGTNGTNGVGYTGVTSTSSIPVTTGLHTWTVANVGAFLPGMRIRAIHTDTPSIWLEGPANVASGTTIIITADKVSGSGTHATWKFAVAGEIGSTGATGATGATGPSGVIAVTAPITNTGTSTSANIGINQAGLTLAQSQITGLVAELANDAKLNAANTFSVGGQLVTNNAVGTVPLTLRSAASQTANMLEIQDELANTYASISRFGTTRLGGAVMSGGRMMIQAGGALVGIQVRDGGTGANIQEWQSAAGAILGLVTSTGTFRTAGLITAGSNTDVLGQLSVITTAASRVGAVIRGAASQTANLQEWQNSAGSILARVVSDGAIRTGTGFFGLQFATLTDYASLRENNSGGRLQMVKQTAADGNPGANNARIYFRDGTTTGTLKLVVRAGAAGAETTILDNIPQ
jgi:collagen type VII alpha